jgi:hypothetical protein
MVEAKGDTSWGAAILRHKAERLKAIFGKERARRYATINPAFCLWSPKESDRLITDGFPEWMLLEKPKSATRTLRWMRLDMPEDRKQVFRCDESGTPSATGTHWTIKQWRKKRAL